MTFNEQALELSIMELFESEGYEHLEGNSIHRKKTDVLLFDDLKSYLFARYSASGITSNEVDCIISMLRSDSGISRAIFCKSLIGNCGWAEPDLKRSIAAFI